MKGISAAVVAGNTGGSASPGYTAGRKIVADGTAGLEAAGLCIVAVLAG